MHKSQWTPSFGILYVKKKEKDLLTWKTFKKTSLSFNDIKFLNIGTYVKRWVTTEVGFFNFYKLCVKCF